MGEREVLQIEIDSSGMVTGSRVGVRSLEDIKKAAGDTDVKVGGLERALRGAGGALSMLGGLAAAVGLTTLLSKTLETTRAYESLRSRLETVMGSAERGIVAMNALTVMAAKTPFQVQELVDAYVRLQAQGIAPTESLMTSLGNTASSMGKSIVDASDALLAAIMGEFERLKSFGIKARIEGEQVAFTFGGVTTKVENNAKAISGFLESIGNSKFAGAMERQSATLNGALSNLEDSAAALMDKVGQNGLSRELGILARQMSTTAASGEGMAKRIGQGLGVLIGSVPILAQAFNVAANSIGIVLGEIATGVLTVVQKTGTGFRALLEAGQAVAGRFGLGDQMAADIAKVDKWLAATQEAIDVTSEFANVSKDQAGAAMLDLGTKWDALVERTLAGSEASTTASASLDELAGSANGAGKAVGLTAKEMAQLVSSLAGLQSKLDPIAAAEREYAESVKIVTAAVQAGLISGEKQLEYLAKLKKALQDVVDANTFAAQSYFPLLEVQSRLETEDFTVRMPPKYEISGSGDAMRAELARVNADFSAGMYSGLSGAFSGALVELATGGEDAVDNLGKAMLDVLLNCVAEWLAAQLAAIAKAAVASKAISGGSGGGGGGAGDAVSLAGSAGGLSSGAWAAIGAVAVMAAVVAIAKYQQDKHYGAQYGTEVGVGVQNGSVVTGSLGQLHGSAAAAQAAIAALLHGFQESTGAFIEGTHNALIQIRNDKEAFRAMVDGVLIGEFNTLQEAIMAATKKMFLSAAAGLDPIFESIIRSFDNAGDPSKLLQALSRVRELLDEASGLSDIQLAIQNLPSQTSALVQELQSLGVGIGEATIVAARWNVQQYQNLRDQITGHEATRAEQMAQKQREAAMFNAQLLLDRAKVAAQIANIEAQIAAFNAENALRIAEVEQDEAHLNAWSLYLIAKNDLYETEAELFQANVNVLGAINEAAFHALAAQLEALREVAEQLGAIDLISPGEIHLPRPGGGGGHNLPNLDVTPPGGDPVAQQVADDIASLYDSLNGFFNSINGWRGRLSEIRNEHARNIELAHGDAEAIALVNLQYEQQIQLLDQEALGSLGLASVTTMQQFEDLADTLIFLQSRGAITEAQMRELGDSMFLSLADGLMQFVEDEDMRRQLEQLRFTMEVANMKLQFQLIKQMGLLTKEQIAFVEDLFALIPDILPGDDDDEPPPHPTPGGGGGGDAAARYLRELVEALNRLRAALESYRDLQAELASGPLSGATLRDRYLAQQSTFEEMLAAAQGGDVAAIEQLPDVIREYLALAGEYLDPSSAAYQALLASIRGDAAGIEGGLEALLAGLPNPNEGVENRLDTIAEILQRIFGIYGVRPEWDPYGGGGPVQQGGYSAAVTVPQQIAQQNAVQSQTVVETRKLRVATEKYARNVESLLHRQPTIGAWVAAPERSA